MSVESLLSGVPVPELIPVRRSFARPRLLDVEGELRRRIRTRWRPGRRARLVRIRNTKTLDVVQVSAALRDDVDRDSRLRREGGPSAMAFDEHGDLL